MSKTKWCYGQTDVPSGFARNPELMARALDAWGLEGWEAWHMENLPDGSRVIYFKIKAEDL